MRTRVYFNGYELTKLCYVSDLKAPLLSRSVTSQTVSGMDGGVFTGATIAPYNVTLTLTVKAKGIEGRQAAERMIAAVLNVDEPAPLALSIDGGLYRYAIPTANGTGTRRYNTTAYDVTFEILDPVAYGMERTVTVPSGGSVTFDVGGTYPASPTITAAAAANDETAGYWRLRLEDGTYLLATIPEGVANAPVDADCGARTLTVNGSTALLVPAADWLQFEPGEHTLTMTGTGEATVTFIERWV